MLRCGALLNFAMQNGAEQNPIDLYTKCGSANDLVMVLCCTELPYHLYPDVLQGCSFAFITNWMGSCHGQILIETETDSYTRYPCKKFVNFDFEKLYHYH